MALILIADDDEIVIDVVRSALEARGHAVGAVDDGAPVMAILDRKRPNLLILDCNMPEMSGVEILRQIRLSPISYATPVLMLTANCGQADEDIARRVGANDYLRKPFDTDELVSRVEAMLYTAEHRHHVDPLPTIRLTPPQHRVWGQR